VELDFQGRARPSISRLYNWRYKKLLDLPSVQKDEFLLANAGLGFDYQLVDVEDYLGRGELEPNAYFFQNLGEAEYIGRWKRYYSLSFSFYLSSTSPVTLSESLLSILP
jgi:intron-binding protein aquarius